MGADIAPFLRLQLRPRLGVEPLQFVMRPRQRVGPPRPLERLDMHREFDHLLGPQFDSADIDQKVADFRGWGVAESSTDHARVEAAYRSREFRARLGLSAIGLVRFVQHDDRAQHLEHVEQAVLDGAALVQALEVREGLEQPVVSRRVVDGGGKKVG